MEGGGEEDQEDLRDEGDVQGQSHHQEECPLSHEREEPPFPDPAPLHRQHAVCLPGPTKPLPPHGLPSRRRPQVPHRKDEEVQ